ncbi:hypothetical protein EAG_13034 [Camponotus floridanus]|uniref:Uncharacterized protein n=1 Tax=Camponotus floridanus TaxID=104421 RepID=E2AGX8_CAMFO|nr:hypothetical protein EAG_13034 [Camponotus floridanus]
MWLTSKDRQPHRYVSSQLEMILDPVFSSSSTAIPKTTTTTFDDTTNCVERLHQSNSLDLPIRDARLSSQATCHA